jgi:hypothetical protein
MCSLQLRDNWGEAYIAFSALGIIGRTFQTPSNL